MLIGLAQINPTVGALEQNAARIIEAYQELVAAGAELVVTPELALTGYPPQDLLFIEGFFEHSLAALKKIESALGAAPLIVGCLDQNQRGSGKPFYNAAAFLRKGEKTLYVHKSLLPTYDVFNETRYFEPGKEVIVIPFKDHNIGITICEDLWSSNYLPSFLYTVDPPAQLVAAGATLLINISASPFEFGKPSKRLAMLQSQARRLHVPIVYCNVVGGNDQLIFDGHSFVLNAEGDLIATLVGCSEEKRIVDLFPNSTAGTNGNVDSVLGSSSISLYTPVLGDEAPYSSSPAASSVRSPVKLFSSEAPKQSCVLVSDEMMELYEVLLLGLRDYVSKCRFEKVLLGLSGGIDSALVATLAVGALGAEAVTGVLMPGPYSSQGSVNDALALADNLKIKKITLPITSLFEELQRLMLPAFAGYQQDATEENMQARLRGMVLMSLSNKWKSLLLTTGNKSELAVGYCTLYGDMCGGLAVLADVPKTLVYKLANWINREKEIIPWASIEKPPSAELRPDQTDQDSLPPYEILDAILELAIEKNASLETIVAHGFDPGLVSHLLELVACNEYKRQQAPPGLKVTERAFSNGRRFPIAQGYKG